MGTKRFRVNERLKSTTRKIRVCIFARVSREKQEFARQLDDLKRYAQERGYAITKTIATKIGGAKTASDRTDLLELLECAKQKAFDKILVTELSRLGRTSKTIRDTIDSLHSSGVSIVFKNLGGIESLDAEGKETFVTNVIIAIHSEMAQEERRLVSSRTKSALNRIRKFKKLGRPEGSAMDGEMLLKKYAGLSKDIKKGLSLRKCMTIHSVSRNTVIKVKRVVFA